MRSPNSPNNTYYITDGNSLTELGKYKIMVLDLGYVYTGPVPNGSGPVQSFVSYISHF